jgi:DNA-binding transcriptional MerR regulator
MEGPMTIREFCRTTSLSAHTLRYYERAGIMPRVERTTSGHRRYTARHILWVQFLRHLRVAGMSVANIRRYASLLSQGPGGDTRRMQMLADHRADVAARVQELQGHLSVLDEKLRKGCGPEVERIVGARHTRTSKKRRTT